ncbi:hypothetical protein AKJ09_06990 [Labilithrix luteola]|uniref:Uncharacterized protein n=1 Tax=Labilithrix luteola TaxID=1391654 RepID=A0A0K1Q3W5_9BACT|nr:hypothetical protein AKJ09_06990 [Labilithrix luteola]
MLGVPSDALRDRTATTRGAGVCRSIHEQAPPSNLRGGAGASCEVDMRMPVMQIRRLPWMEASGELSLIRQRYYECCIPKKLERAVRPFFVGFDSVQRAPSYRF